MNSRERVLKTIRHEVPDRVPLNVWIYRAEVEAGVVAKYGSLDAFYDAMHTDIFTSFTHSAAAVVRNDYAGRRLNFDEVKRLKWPDPLASRIYDAHVHSAMPVQEALAKYKPRRALFGHVWGVVETIQGMMGIENMLMHIAMNKDTMKDLFAQSADWSVAVANRIMDMGIDVLEISDDWGANDALMFSPKDWWELVYPAEKKLIAAARERNVPVCLHSDGYVYDVLPGIIEMGADILHPVQASAGMDQAQVKREFGDRICIYGGLDVSRTLPHGTEEEIVAEVQEKMRVLKPNGGYILCTAHSVQEDTTLDKVELAYKTALENSYC